MQTVNAAGSALVSSSSVVNAREWTLAMARLQEVLG
jgi:hypothetical protein